MTVTRDSQKAIFLIGLLLLLACCNKKETSYNAPRIAITMSPAKGLTTTIFSFDLSGSEFDKPDQNKLFFRWDWNNDGIWDSPFSNKSQFEHRFLISGKKVTRVIAMDLNGLSDTVQFEMIVEQGYSKPKPHLVITPSRGTPFTEFILDASGTTDDEDSIGTLQFRWDLDGNRQFETDYGSSSIYRYKYPTIGIYLPSVEVRDTTGLSDRVSGRVEITLWDPSIIAEFSWTPQLPVSGDNIVFDASASHDSLYPDRPMNHRWDWQNDGIFDTEYSTSPQMSYSFPSEGVHVVCLEIKNYRGLYNRVVKEISIGHRNQPPVASFAASSIGGNTQTRIRFDLWDCRDLENSPSELLSRWDWNGDGVWDTGFTNNMEVFHVFTEPGVYPVKLNISDQGGLMDIATKTIYIGSGTNLTDILLDKRGTGGWEYYGIVKIGDQWWFSKNLQLIVNELVSGFCYSDYGCLYPSTQLQSLCPAGWRIPTKNDWDQLLSQYEPSVLYSELSPGGISGFNIVLAGMVNNDVIPSIYSGKDYNGNYWSQTTLSGSSGQSNWIVTFDARKRQVLPGFNLSSGLYSVRCMKDAN